MVPRQLPLPQAQVRAHQILQRDARPRVPDELERAKRFFIAAHLPLEIIREHRMGGAHERYTPRPDEVSRVFEAPLRLLEK